MTYVRTRNHGITTPTTATTAACLCPSWHALKVAVANAVHDVEEHKVNRNLGSDTDSYNAPPARAFFRGAKAGEKQPNQPGTRNLALHGGTQVCVAGWCYDFLWLRNERGSTQGTALDFWVHFPTCRESWRQLHVIERSLAATVVRLNRLGFVSDHAFTAVAGRFFCSLRDVAGHHRKRFLDANCPVQIYHHHGSQTMGAATPAQFVEALITTERADTGIPCQPSALVASPET